MAQGVKGTSPPCSVAECERRSEKRGLCNMHWKRWMRHGDAAITKKAANGTRPATCTHDGCDRPHQAEGYCAGHHSRIRRYGDPNAGGGSRVHGELEERIARLSVGMPNGCIQWTGEISTGGYGLVSLGGRRWTAHRVVYELRVGPIPDGLQLDHMCHNDDLSCAGGPSCQHKRCINVDHLIPATPSENVGRALGPRKVQGCKEAGCGREHHARGWCRVHYMECYWRADDPKRRAAS